MKTKQQQVRRVLLTTLILNLAVATGKIVVGLVTGALAITADGLHSVVDSSGNVIGLIATRFADQPPDDDHPYGHGRIETLAALVIGALLLLTAWEVGKGAVERILSGDAPDITPLSFVIMLATLPVNLFVSRYQTRAGKRLESQILLADAANTRADVFVTLSVLVSMALVTLFGWGWVDVVAALAVTVLIGRAGWQILRQTGRVLVDAAPYEPAQLAEYVLQVPAVEQVARVRSRGSTDAPHIDVDVQVAPATTAEKTSAIASAIREKLSDQLGSVGEVEVHFVPDDDRAPDYALLARACADALALTTHEVCVSDRPDGKVLEMHVEVPSVLTLDQAHEQVSLLEHNIHAAAPEIAEVITHIEPAALPDLPVADRIKQLEARARDLLDEQYPGLNWHHVRVYPGQSGLDVSMHVTLPPQMAIEAAHRLAEDAELFLRSQMPQIARLTIHTEPTEQETAR